MPIRIISRGNVIQQGSPTVGPGIPAGGVAGQVLQKTSAISYQVAWVTPMADSELHVSWGNIQGIPSEFPPAPHDHNDLYYTKSEVDAKIPTQYNILLVDGWQFNALKDDDDDALQDVDGAVIYEPGDVFDNPPFPSRNFDTIADMLAAPGDSWDTAVVRNGLDGDGQRTHWRMSADPNLADNGTNVRLTTDGYGFAERLAILN
jgi:hypothetical protein